MSSLGKYKKKANQEELKHPVEKIVESSTNKKQGRPTSKRNYTKRTVNFEDALWENLKLAAILQETSITDLLHKAARTYLSGNFSLSELEMLSKLVITQF